MKIFTTLKNLNYKACQKFFGTNLHPLARRIHSSGGPQLLNPPKIKLPNNIGVIGYGAIGRATVDMIVQNYPNARITVTDIAQPFDVNPKVKYIQHEVTRQNVKQLLQILNLKAGDVLIDLSTNIDVIDIWELCMQNGVNYANAAMEEYADSTNPTSLPKNTEEMNLSSLGHRHDQAENSKFWNPQKGGTTSIFESGMNPGLINHCVKQGLEDAAAYFLTRPDWKDLNHNKIREYLKARNHSKLAQELGLHTAHCSEVDNQYLDKPPEDRKTKFYNTWSCRGFLTEGMVPIQIARGSHEDETSEEFPRIRNGTTFCSWKPSNKYKAKSYVPFEDIEGTLIPHGEAYTIREYLSDKETGYAPSQYYVYQYNQLAADFIDNLPADATLQTTNPEMEVLHPFKWKLQGYDKVGAMLCFKNNRGWWTGSVMDEFDSMPFFNHKYGPTVLQVAAGMYASWIYMIMNPKIGNKWHDWLPSDFILKQSYPYLGRFISVWVDLNKTKLKDCYKFEDFITQKK